MSTDRKLLELAAKAVGIVIDKSTTNGGGAGNTGFDMLGNAVLDWHNNIKWNPLTNDGDALRVAVKLNLIVECMKGQSAARTFDSKHAGACDFPAYRQDGCKRAHEPDQYAATRRAIVLAAAIQQAEAQQPATPEPVAWIRRHPNGALSNELLIHVQVEQVRRDSGAWVPLYTHPAPGVPDDVVRDAIATVREQYRGTDWGKDAECICDAIDAAMLAAKDASA